MRIFVPCDAAAIAVGADAVANAIEAHIAAEKSRRRLDAEVIRNGSRGLFWLEPLVEVETPAGRVAYGPVSADNVEELFESGLLEGKPHPLCLGLTEEIPYLKTQERLTFARCGIVFNDLGTQTKGGKCVAEYWMTVHRELIASSRRRSAGSCRLFS